MKDQFNGIRVVVIFFLFFLSFCVNSQKNYFDIVVIPRPLVIDSIPIQKAQVNSNFNLNLAPYFNKLLPEVDYKVTNNSKGTFPKAVLWNLPQGITRVFSGPRLCTSNFFLLGPGSSCEFRFVIDKSKYVPNPSPRAGPLVCPDDSRYICFPPQQGFYHSVRNISDTTQPQIIPAEQYGLRFDPETVSIVGVPTRTGVYSFTVGGRNNQEVATPRELQIEVSIDPKDTPKFKTNYTLASAIPGQNYSLNMLELLEPTPGFMVTNQVRFYIDTDKPYPSWLSIDPSNVTILQGQVPQEEAGQEREITIIAESNTGGMSLPLTIKIPVAFDPAKRPVIHKDIQLTGVTSVEFQSDLRSKIEDPTNDGSLKLVIDKIEPSAEWLSISKYSPTELSGVVPPEAVGVEYQIAVHANTKTGGNSDVLVIPLKIAIDKKYTPKFYLAHPQFPLLYAGQPYVHDFVSSNDIEPKYSDYPFTVALAQGYNNPSWLRIENNQLIIDKVPDHLQQIEHAYITITNVPGGTSDVYKLDLIIMN